MANHEAVVRQPWMALSKQQRTEAPRLVSIGSMTYRILCRLKVETSINKLDETAKLGGKYVFFTPYNHHGQWMASVGRGTQSSFQGHIPLPCLDGGCNGHKEPVHTILKRLNGSLRILHSP